MYSVQNRGRRGPSSFELSRMIGAWRVKRFDRGKYNDDHSDGGFVGALSGVVIGVQLDAVHLPGVLAMSTVLPSLASADVLVGPVRSENSPAEASVTIVMNLCFLLF